MARIKESIYSKTKYIKIRNNPHLWKEHLAKQRARYKLKGRNRKTLFCIECNKPFLTTRYCQKFCSRECGIGGNRNGNWNGGRCITVQGYVKVFAPGHPHATRNLVSEHRLVMEKHIGRYLTREEVVHHKNRIKSDNRLENLELMTHKQHSQEHNLGNQYWKKRKHHYNGSTKPK